MLEGGILTIVVDEDGWYMQDEAGQRLSEARGGPSSPML